MKRKMDQCNNSACPLHTKCQRYTAHPGVSTANYTATPYGAVCSWHIPFFRPDFTEHQTWDDAVPIERRDFLRTWDD